MIPVLVIMLAFATPTDMPLVEVDSMGSGSRVMQGPKSSWCPLLLYVPFCLDFCAGRVLMPCGGFLLSAPARRGTQHSSNMLHTSRVRIAPLRVAIW